MKVSELIKVLSELPDHKVVTRGENQGYFFFMSVKPSNIVCDYDYDEGEYIIVLN